MNAVVAQDLIPFYNALTKQPYSAKNSQLLYEAAMLAGIEDRAVAGFKQWLELGRVVKKGQHGTRIYMCVDKKDAAPDGPAPASAVPASSGEVSKHKVMKGRAVFFLSQTIPLGGEANDEPPAPAPGPASTPEPALASVSAPTVVATNASSFVQRRQVATKNKAPALRSIAENLQSKIDNAFGNRLENTPKRRREAASARNEGRRLQRTQQALNRLADLHDAGTVPAALVGVTTKVKVYELCASVLDGSRCGYYDAYVDTGKPYYSTPDAVALWALLEQDDTALATEALRRKIATVRQMDIPGFVATPLSLVDRMLDLADISEGMSVLEPSAGDGAIACRIAERHPGAQLDTYEINRTLQEVLQGRGLNVVGSDFLAGEVSKLYDRIVMNPPFERFADIDHVRRAYAFLRTGGKLVSVMGSSAFYRDTAKAVAFRAWIDEVGAVVEKLPEGTFAPSGTSANSNLVRITRTDDAP